MSDTAREMTTEEADKLAGELIQEIEAVADTISQIRKKWEPLGEKIEGRCSPQMKERAAVADQRIREALGL